MVLAAVVFSLLPFAPGAAAQADPQPPKAAGEPETATWEGTVDSNYLAVQRPGGKKREPRTKAASVSRGLTIEIEYLDPPKQKTRRFRGQWIEDDCRQQYGDDPYTAAARRPSKASCAAPRCGPR